MDVLEEIKKKSISYLSFKVGNEVFASHVSHVNNIVEVSRITKIPKSPDYLVGVINLRGQVLPVIDTRVRFGMSPTEVTTNTCILVLEIKSDDEILQVGGLVDSVSEVLEIKESEIMSPPKVGLNASNSFIAGVTNVNDSFIMLLDMNQLFEDADLSAVAEQIKQIKEDITVK